MNKRERIKNAAYLVVILMLVFVFLISGLRILESTVLHYHEQQQELNKKTIIRNGIE